MAKRKLRDVYGISHKRVVKKKKADFEFRFPKLNQNLFLRIGIWVLAVLAIILGGFFGGKLVAGYAFSNTDPYSFFKDGKYLILFQNNTELRGSGGFLGSFAVLEMKDYEVRNLSFETNIYKLDSAYTAKNYVEAPEPIADFIHGRSWALRDANYDVSFPEAAQDVNDFYQKETGNKIDGIIAVNASLIQDLLKVTGPIKMEKYQTTISADNFFRVTQTEIEKDYYQNPENALENEPKTIIKDLYPEVISRALRQNKISLFLTLGRELDEKNIQIYFLDQEKEKLIYQKGWAGEVKTNAELKKILGDKFDYLNINVSNFGGNKSSLSVKSHVEYQVTPNGLVELVITRTHGGTATWPDGANSSYVRVLVPTGTVLKSAYLNDREITASVKMTTEVEKNCFGTNVLVGPGQATVLKLSYELPYKISDYRLAIQKQSGVLEDEWKVIFDKKVKFDEVLKHDVYLK